MYKNVFFLPMYVCCMMYVFVYIFVFEDFSTKKGEGDNTEDKKRG